MKFAVNNDVVLSQPLEGPLSTYIPGLRSGLVRRDTLSPPDNRKCISRLVLVVGLGSKLPACASSAQNTRLDISGRAHAPCKSGEATLPRCDSCLAFCIVRACSPRRSCHPLVSHRSSKSYKHSRVTYVRSALCRK